MKPHKDYIPHGVIPACLLPFEENFSIDEKSYRAHVRDVGLTPGISAVTINAHASEVASCSFEEQCRLLDISQDEIGDQLPIIHGVYADNTFEAVRIARMAAKGASSALLIFPPAPFTLGHSTAMVMEHFSRIADATDLPLIVFQYPISSGQGYSIDTLTALAEKIPTISAIKDWSGNPQLHEQQIRLLQSLPRPVNVLSTHSAWLLSSLVLGCNGLLSGSGSVIAREQVKLYDAIIKKDLTQAQAVAHSIFPLTSVFYSTPWVDMHNRMKEALVMLGRIKMAVVRPPLVRISEGERTRIHNALRQSGIFIDANLHVRENVII